MSLPRDQKSTLRAGKTHKISLANAKRRGFIWERIVGALARNEMGPGKGRVIPLHALEIAD